MAPGRMERRGAPIVEPPRHWIVPAAKTVAPEAAPVYHQMSNVAYLRGDLKAAVAALDRALALDPGNALFRTNLERLRRRQSPPR